MVSALLRALVLVCMLVLLGCPSSERVRFPGSATDIVADVSPRNPGVPPIDISGKACITTSDCAEDLHCDPARNACVACVEDDHCELGEACVGGRCMPEEGCDVEGGCDKCETSEECPEERFCDKELCVPDICEAGDRVCAGQQVMICRDDGSGWDKGDACSTGQVCKNGACQGECKPKCEGRNCGKDGCGGTCGECEDGRVCADGSCLGDFGYPCVDGDDCASGYCTARVGDERVCTIACDGPCPEPGWTCREVREASPDVVYLCLWDPDCEPACDGRECGPDGCEGTCGICPEGTACSRKGRCESKPQPGSCTDIYKCMLGCSHHDDPNACAGECWAVTDPEAMDRYKRLYECLIEVCGQEIPDERCAEKAVTGPCRREMARCVGECEPTCWGPDGERRQCGPDGCGGSCGACPPDHTCGPDGFCHFECEPMCWDRECGPDGCGGECGFCWDGTFCTPGGFCKDECHRSCENRECGPDGCGGECGYCGPGSVCMPEGFCRHVCEPICWRDDGTMRECGPDGCGGECGYCDADSRCDYEWGKCVPVCEPRCMGRQCGDDGCGGSCGWCDELSYCERGRCVPSCTPQCRGRQCGPNGCGGTCGRCPPATTCGDDGRCHDVCVPSCRGRECGPNGCGGSCGSCHGESYCSIDGRCLRPMKCEEAYYCVLECAGDPASSNMPADPIFCLDVCGVDMADESAEMLLDLVFCTMEVCGPISDRECMKKAAETECRDQYNRCVGCEPSCIDAAGQWRECGPDGCGSVCGYCDDDAQCENGRCIDVCIPRCGDRRCGSDGCGGVCGLCPPYEQCMDGRCEPVCVPRCDGRECGSDGCGGSCGYCPPDQTCTGAGRCSGGCIAACTGKQCGSDGCGGSCGYCPAGTFCNQDWRCEPLCEARCYTDEGDRADCGPDGCGGTCGTCTSQEYCDHGRCRDFISCSDLQDCFEQCGPDEECANDCWYKASPEARRQWDDFNLCLIEVCGYDGTDQCYQDAFFNECRDLYYACLDCTPNCQGKECGPDGCGGQCGRCPGGRPCGPGGLCPCVPSCQGRECGPDGCGGACGKCKEGMACASYGRCICLPNCENRECGQDGCGGTCGYCPPGFTCTPEGWCKESCIPRCDGRECGSDGCGGECGYCPAGEICQGGRCAPLCTPRCQGRQCGPDGCGGACGKCPESYFCNSDGRCQELCTPSCRRAECGPDGCGGSCGSCPPDNNCISGNCEPFVSCADILDCSWSCPDGDEDCGDKCFQSGSPEAKQQFFDLWICLVNACDGNPDGVCSAQQISAGGACAGEYNECRDCTPNCEGRNCGGDGCGGSCGTCPEGVACDEAAGICACVPTCRNRECGPDGCGGSCGQCPADTVCSSGGRCVCLPDCRRRECGQDGCGGSCGQCPDNARCENGRCIPDCVPNCMSPEGWPRECGDDGCGGSCGECPPFMECDPWMGFCMPVCEPQCWDPWTGMEYECGDDGCGGSCGYCPPGLECMEGFCKPYCKPKCWTEDGRYRECGPDGCGGECGYCGPNAECWDDGMCHEVHCEPRCEGRECGPDNCGGTCGECPRGWTCNYGRCDPPEDGKRCPEIMQCAMSRCLSNGGMPDPTCYQPCTEGAAPGESDKFFAVVTCVIGECIFDFSAECMLGAMSGACRDEWERCQASNDP